MRVAGLLSRETLIPGILELARFAIEGFLRWAAPLATIAGGACLRSMSKRVKLT